MSIESSYMCAAGQMVDRVLSPTTGFGKSWEARVDGLHVTVTAARERATA